MLVRRLIGGLAVGSLVIACGGAAATPAPPAATPAPPAATPAPPAGTSAAGGDVQATETEWAISISTDTLSAGEHTFSIQNNGEKTHEFVVVKTALAQDALPVVEDEIPEDSDQLEAVDEVEDIEPGATPSLTVTLDPGHYVIFCNLTAHYGKGMHSEFTVE